jgi:hypothetical protein
MQKLKLMTDKFIFVDTDKFSDRFMQPDSTAFISLDNLTQIDKKENIICHRFAFLNISKNPVSSPFAALILNAKVFCCKRANN